MEALEVPVSATAAAAADSSGPAIVDREGEIVRNIASTLYSKSL